MSKLIYVQDNNDTVFDILLQTLIEHGYTPEYTTTAAADDCIHADIAVLCQPFTRSNRITLGDITLDLDGVFAFDKSGNRIHFTPIEYSMLSYLMKNAHRAVPRTELLSAVWGFEGNSNTRVTDDTAKRLRRKLRESSLVLETVWNFGFHLREK